MELELQKEKGAEQQGSVCLHCAGRQVPAASEIGCKDSEAMATDGGAREFMGWSSIYDRWVRLRVAGTCCTLLRTPTVRLTYHLPGMFRMCKGSQVSDYIFSCQTFRTKPFRMRSPSCNEHTSTCQT